MSGKRIIGRAKFDRRSKKITYTIRVYENRKVIEKVVYTNQEDYVKECVKRGLIMNTYLNNEKG